MENGSGKLRLLFVVFGSLKYQPPWKAIRRKQAAHTSILLTTQEKRLIQSKRSIVESLSLITGLSGSSARAAGVRFTLIIEYSSHDFHVQAIARSFALTTCVALQVKLLR